MIKKLTITKKLFLAAALVAAVAAGNAEAGKGGKGGGKGGGGGGGGVSTNYGCQTFPAGTVFVSADGSRTTQLLASTYTCYLCNLTTHVCTIQSPASYYGWTFIY